VGVFGADGPLDNEEGRMSKPLDINEALRIARRVLDEVDEWEAIHDGHDYPYGYEHADG
jgi:hypothetical protein